MREIKLRGYNKINGTMEKPWSIGTEVPIIIPKWAWNISPSDYIIMQFTGSYDINKNEIYEGDILEVAHDEIGSPIPNSFVGSVKFMEGGFWVDDNCTAGFPVWQEITEWSVIGNIYENQKLLSK